MGVCVGIDLGTTYSSVAYVNNYGKADIIKNAYLESVTPSVLAIVDNDILFGQDAKDYQESGQKDVASFYKRMLGDENISLNVGGKQLSPTDLSSLFLKELVKDAENTLGQKIDSAVITIPAYFASKEREATIQAGKNAGLNVLGLLSEPSAAAYAYGLTNNVNEQIVLIYDLGGGTFDITIARITSDEVHILGCDGNHHLGGKDWDDALVRYLLECFCDNTDFDYDALELEETELNAVLVQAEQIKKQLSTKSEVKTNILLRGQAVSVSISRETFEQLTSHLLLITTDLIQKLLTECNLSYSDLDGFILVGGSTRMCAVSDFLYKATGKKPFTGINPEEAVALGAAIHASILNKKTLQLAGESSPIYSIKGEKQLVDSTAHALGMIAESEDRSRYINSIIIPKNASIPAQETKDFKLRVPKEGGILEIYVLQGSNIGALDNIVYAKYIVQGIEQEAKESTISVTYKYTENATIEVVANQPAINKLLAVEKTEIEADLSRFALSPKDLEPKVAQIDMDVMIYLDTSGSMSGQPIELALDSIKNFVESIETSSIKIGFASFADKTNVYVKPTDNYEEFKTYVDKCSVGNEGYGNAADPMKYHLEHFKSRIFSGHDTKDVIIILTDGEWNNPDLAIKSADKLMRSNTTIIAIGFGDANQAFLDKIATSKDFSKLIDITQLSETFSTIGRAFSSGSSLSLN